MLNVVLFRSDDPWRFPLNVRSGLAVNVGVGWIGYLLAALLAQNALWLGLATVLVSLGNCIARVLTPKERKRLRAIVEYLKPAHTHFVDLVEPLPTVLPDHWEIGVSEVGVTTFAH